MYAKMRAVAARGMKHVTWGRVALAAGIILSIVALAIVPGGVGKVRSTASLAGTDEPEGYPWGPSNPWRDSYNYTEPKRGDYIYMPMALVIKARWPSQAEVDEMLEKVVAAKDRAFSEAIDELHLDMSTKDLEKIVLIRPYYGPIQGQEPPVDWRPPQEDVEAARAAGEKIRVYRLPARRTVSIHVDVLTADLGEELAWDIGVVLAYKFRKVSEKLVPSIEGRRRYFVGASRVPKQYVTDMDEADWQYEQEKEQEGTWEEMTP